MKLIIPIYSKSKIIFHLSCLLLLTSFCFSQQVIGSFPNMNGGFEGYTAGNITSTATSDSNWWIQGPIGNTIQIKSVSGARTGVSYLNAVQTGTTARRIHSPTSNTQMNPGTIYTVQFYYIGDKDGTPHATQTMSGALYNTYSTPETKFQPWLNPSNSNWTKNVFTMVAPLFTNLATGYGVIRLNNGCTFDFDDFVVYEGAVDNTVPEPATGININSNSNQNTISWTTPVSGVDGGGYMIVKYTTNPSGQPEPNVNGIYAVGNNIGAGTVVYLGTSNNYLDTSATAGNPYYYRVYTVDKAFNYSSPLTGSTGVNYSAEPTASTTGINFSNVTSSSMTINLTSASSGGGTNHLVVIGASLSGEPGDGYSYNADANFSNNSNNSLIGGKVVYNGTGNTINITGLSFNNIYTVRVYDFNGNPGTENYLTSNFSTSTISTSIVDIDITTSSNLACTDLTINSGKTLTIGAGKKLTVTGNLVNNGTIVFKSNATGTAMFDVYNGSQLSLGVATVERYIPQGKRAFRLLSPAVTTTAFISGNWQQQTHITGGLGTTGLGFDATETNNPSMFTYNNQAAQGVSGWAPIPNTNNTDLIAGVGYRMLIRGNTSVDLTAPSADAMNAAITLSATGTLKTGTVSLNASSTPSINNTTNTVTDGYSLVGNPYQSAVDWHLVTRTGIEDTYYAWAPNMGTGTARGNYVAYSVTSGNNGGGSVDRYIQPGQAFFVKNTGSSAGTLTFQEAHKATTSANVFRTANETESANSASLSVQLFDPNELAIGAYPIDATKAVFSSAYTNELGLGDATKLEAAGENIAWYRNNTKLAIDAAAPVTTSDELAMKTLRLGANKNYTFKIQTTNFDTTLTPYLVDNFLNTQTAISTSEVYLATFSTTSNTASYGEDRFKIVFQTSALSTDDFVKNIKLYPNPAKAGASFYIDGITEATVSVYNVVGQNIPVTVMSQGNAVQVTPTTALSQGVYLITVTTAGKTAQVKWIVE